MVFATTAFPLTSRLLAALLLTASAAAAHSPADGELAKPGIAPANAAVVGLTLTPFGGAYRAGSVLSLAYSATGEARQPGARLRAELSDAHGSFVRPTRLGAVPLDGPGAGVVAVRLPRTVAAGRAYRVRLVRTDLPAALASADNGRNLTLRPAPVRHHGPLMASRGE